VPLLGWSRLNFAEIFSIRKLQSLGYCTASVCDATDSHFSGTPTCDRQTDRQTTTANTTLAWRRTVKLSSTICISECILEYASIPSLTKKSMDWISSRTPETPLWPFLCSQWVYPCLLLVKTKPFLYNHIWHIIEARSNNRCSASRECINLSTGRLQHRSYRPGGKLAMSGYTPEASMHRSPMGSGPGTIIWVWKWLPFNILDMQLMKTTFQIWMGCGVLAPVFGMIEATVTVACGSIMQCTNGRQHKPFHHRDRRWRSTQSSNINLQLIANGGIALSFDNLNSGKRKSSDSFKERMRCSGW